MPSVPSGWSYTPGDADKDKVRFLIGDTNPLAPILLDAEIAFALTEQTDIYLAAALCCESIALKLAPTSNSTLNGVMSTGDVSGAYRELAATLRARADGRAAIPYAGGISVADKDSNELDDDLVKGSFTRNLFTHPGNRMGSNQPSSWSEEYE